MATLTTSQVREHASRNSCWVMIKGHAYDLTSYLDAHPGGSQIILKHAGKDATEIFEPIHPSDTLDKFLKPHQKLGPVAQIDDVNPTGRLQAHKVGDGKPGPRLSAIINIRDFERAASKVLSARSYAFFRTGAEDEVTADWNRNSWSAVRFRPRVLRPIRIIDLSTSILGTDFAAPFFICPAGGAKLANPAGDVLLTETASKHGILHWVCNNAGCTQEEIASVRTPSQALYWQIYAASDLKVTEAEVRSAIERGFRGFALTVDAIRAGKRERDVRQALEEESECPSAQADESNAGDEDGEDEGFASGPTVKRAHVYTDFDWLSAMTWLRSLTDLPIAIKGIQCWEDAKLCMEHGVHPWLSNHAGRQLDGAPSAADTLVAIRKHCPEVFDRCEVIVDGGVTRGTDIVKALALGARGVGLGRAFLYSMVFGAKGINKAIRILLHEVETTMALLGVTNVAQLNPSFVDTSALIFASAMNAKAHL